MRGSVELSSEPPYEERLQIEIESLRDQLAAALAACKVKDEAMNGALYSGSPYTTAFENALATQPDDSALKAWLGEPVAWMNGHLYFTTMDMSEAQGYSPLYAPKGMK